MVWTLEHRRAADRRGLRCPSDLTDPEWQVVRPPIRPAQHGGHPRTVHVREVLNAIVYLLSTGCQWGMLPKDLPPKSTARGYFSRWDWDGTPERIHHALYVAVREQSGARPARPRRSSAARRRKARRRRRHAPSLWPRRGQKGRRAQAPPADRHARPRVRRAASSTSAHRSRHTGP